MRPMQATSLRRTNSFVRLTYNCGQYYVHQNGTVVFTGTFNDATAFCARQYKGVDVVFGW